MFTEEKLSRSKWNNLCQENIQIDGYISYMPDELNELVLPPALPTNCTGYLRTEGK
jgi:hypothetical protein